MPAIDPGKNKKFVAPKAKRPKKRTKPYKLPQNFKSANSQPETKVRVRKTKPQPGVPNYGPRTVTERVRPRTLPQSFKSANSSGPDLTKSQKRDNDKKIVKRHEKAWRKYVREDVDRQRKEDAATARDPFRLTKGPTFGIGRSRYEEARKAGREAEPPRDKDTKIGPFNLEAELEGRGLLQKAAEKAKKAGPKTSFTYGPGGKKVSTSSAGLLTNQVPSEVIDLTANLPSGAYMTGAATKEALQGRPDRGKELIEDFKKSSALVPLVQGDLKEAGKRARRSPVTTALEVSGAKALVGRGGGIAGRHAPMPKGKMKDKVRSAASTKREPLRLYEDHPEGPKVEREYSRDIINKALQVAGERRTRKGSRRRKDGSQRVPGRDPNVDRGQYLVPGMPGRQGGGLAPRGDGLMAPTRSKLLRRVDTRQFSQDRVRRSRKDRAVKETRKILKKVNPAGVQLLAEGTGRLTNVRGDLRKRLLSLAKEANNLRSHPDPERYKLNREEAKHVRELLALPDKDLTRVAEAARRFADSQESVQRRGRRVGAWNEVGQSKRFYPALQSHIRVKPREERTGLTTEEKAIAAKVLQRRVRRGQPIPKKARADFDKYLDQHKRRTMTPERKLDESELAAIARILQRRERRGQEGLAGLPQGGPAFVTQRPNKGNPWSTMGLQSNPLIPHANDPTRRRKGTAFEEGSRTVGRDALNRQVGMAESQVTTAENVQLIDREFGRPAAENGARYAKSFDEALATSRRISEDFPDQPPYVPVNISALQTFGSRLRRKQEEGHRRPEQDEQAAEAEMWGAATDEHGAGRWVLMPADVVGRFRQHAGVETHGALHSATNLFKDVVLTTSSPARWIGGNVTDIGMRSAFAGITPIDVIRGRMITRRAMQEGLQGEQSVSATTGGGLYHASEAMDRTFRTGHNESTARTVLSAPWRTWKGGVYAIEHFIEELPQWGMVGKAMVRDTGRKLPERDDGMAVNDRKMKDNLKALLALHDEQVTNFAHRLATDRGTEAKIQKMTEDVIGRWGKVSPNMRKALVIAPFAQWLGAATRYVYVTLPVHHPIKTSILAGISQMTEEERSRLGLSYRIPRDQQAYDYQMGTLPMKVGKNEYGPVVEGVRTSRMTSLGTAAAVPGDIGNFLFPQFAGALDAWAGTSFTNEQLVYPDWWPEKELRRLPLPPDERIKVGLGALMESTIPFASAFRRSVLEKGEPAEPYSTILTPELRKKWDKEQKKYTENKGTVAGGLLEWLSPFAPSSRIYTYGAGKAIEEGGITSETLETWRQKPKPGTKDPYGFNKPKPAGTVKPLSKDPYGFNKGSGSKSKSADNPYGF